MLFRKKKENELCNSTEDIKVENENCSQEIKAEAEWIWVEGYKGTDVDMQCRGLKYEVGNTIKFHGDVEMCNSGFHLCKDLKDVFNYYSLGNKNRFFKVKALVKKLDYDNYSSNCFYMVDCYGRRLGNNNDKLVAKEIEFIEELKFKDLEKYILNLCPLVINEQDWNLYNKIGESEYIKKYFIEQMVQYGYSNTFALVLFSEPIKETGRTSDIYLKVLNKAKAFKEENISADMGVYLLLQK